MPIAEEHPQLPTNPYGWSKLFLERIMNDYEPGDFGTVEFIALARAVGAEPSITVNVEGRGATVAEAAAWVEYCNGPATSKYGAMRVNRGSVLLSSFQSHDLGTLHRSAVCQIDSG
jgi:UDP-glucose 4-epimerase